MFWEVYICRHYILNLIECIVYMHPCALHIQTTLVIVTWDLMYVMFVHRKLFYLAKSKYFTNLGFPEIMGFPLLNHHLGAQNSCFRSLSKSCLWKQLLRPCGEYLDPSSLGAKWLVPLQTCQLNPSLRVFPWHPDWKVLVYLNIYIYNICIYKSRGKKLKIHKPFQVVWPYKRPCLGP